MGRFTHTGARIGTLATLGGAVLLTSACTMGPDFDPPAAPAESGYTPETPAHPAAAGNVPGGDAQHFVPGADIPGQWWTLFRSDALNELIEQSLKANPDLQAAEASLRQSQELALAKGGVLYPQVSGGYSDERDQSPPAKSGKTGKPVVYTLSSASLSVSYALDVFGGNRRAVEAAEAQADYQRFQLEAAYLTLTSNVVTAAVQDASLRGQIAATREIVDYETQQLDVVRRQFELGGASRADVLAQESTLSQTLASLPNLEKQLAQQRNRLTVLAGRFPNQEVEQRFDLASMKLPEDLPLSLPSKLVEQRPDIKAASATLHQASAEIGVAIANQLPQFNLSAEWGSAANHLDGLFSPGSTLWSLAGGITQPIFKGGQLEHERRAAEAAFESAAAQYRSTVLSAFQDVANALRALQTDADRLKAQVEADRTARESLDLSRQQYAAGAISYLTLLNAENSYQQAHINLVEAEAARYADTAALFQALGGGWWNRTDVATADKADR